MTRPFSTRTIEEVIATLIDYRGKTPTKTSNGVRLITAKVVKDGRILDEPAEFIAEEDYDSWMRRGLPKSGDVLITTEAPLGEVAILREERVALAQRIILLRGNPEMVDAAFLFQALKSPFVRGELAARGTGTTVLGIKQSELRKVRLPWYQLPAQRRISGVLSAYDNLIENNIRRIAILEGMARALYREWFVEFRFPGHEKTRMAKARGKLFPDGWTCQTLGELVHELRDAVDPKTIDAATPYVGLEHLPRRSTTLVEWGLSGDVESTKLQFCSGDILFGKIRPYFHKVAVAPFDGVSSSDAIVMRLIDSELFGLVLGCVSSDEFVAHATQTSNGTKMPRANWSVLKEYPVSVPPTPILARFNAVARDAVAEAQVLAAKNRNLRATRDLLLPKLISGEIDVSNLPVPEASDAL